MSEGNCFREMACTRRRVLSLVLLGLVLLGVAVPQVRAAAIAIVQPANKETIHSNRGEVMVRVRYSTAVANATVRLWVDGAARPEAYHRGIIRLHGIYRGTHTLKAQLLGQDGKVLASSGMVTFYLWHASRLFHHPSR